MLLCLIMSDIAGVLLIRRVVWGSWGMVAVERMGRCLVAMCGGWRGGSEGRECGEGETVGSYT